MLGIPTLNISVNGEYEHLLNQYKNIVEQHNYDVDNSECPKIGFNLLTPKKYDVSPLIPIVVDFYVKLNMIIDGVSVGLQIIPHSNMANTPLMMANQVEIIPPGHTEYVYIPVRGFRDYTIEKNSQLVQVCHPSLCKFYVALVE